VATVVVRNATNSDETLSANIFTTALADDPVSRWLIANRHDRRRIHYRYVHRLVSHSLDVGTVEIASAPANAASAQNVVALAGIAAAALCHLDPMVQLFFWMGTLAGLGVVALMALASAAVVGFFWRDHRGEPAVYRLVLPVVSVLGLGVVVVLTLTQYATLLGVAAASPVTWRLPSLLAAAWALGVLRAGYLHARRARRAPALLVAGGGLIDRGRDPLP
jgi:hypothetical protein